MTKTQSAVSKEIFRIPSHKRTSALPPGPNSMILQKLNKKFLETTSRSVNAAILILLPQDWSIGKTEECPMPLTSTWYSQLNSWKSGITKSKAWKKSTPTSSLHCWEVLMYQQGQQHINIYYIPQIHKLVRLAYPSPWIFLFVVGMCISSL